MQEKDYELTQGAVVCPECGQAFITPEVASLPALSEATVIEADLHRVLPTPEIRDALVAMCPNCLFTWWLSGFTRYMASFTTLPFSPQTEYSKKFAHAVLTGRKKNAHSLDRALLALNGYWCAREASQPADKWLKLTALELNAALNDTDWEGNRSRYHYILGEICRLKGDTDGSLKHFDLVDEGAHLPKGLVEQQRNKAVQGDIQPTVLSPEVIHEAIFS